MYKKKSISYKYEYDNPVCRKFKKDMEEVGALVEHVVISRDWQGPCVKICPDMIGAAELIKKTSVSCHFYEYSTPNKPTLLIKPYISGKLILKPQQKNFSYCECLLRDETAGFEYINCQKMATVPMLEGSEMIDKYICCLNGECQFQKEIIAQKRTP